MTASDGRTDWSNFVNWHLVLPPNRPPEWFLDIVRRELATVEEGDQVLVLGSTPELCDLVSDSTAHLVVIDRDRHFYKLMLQLRRSPSPTETFLEGDWLAILPSFGAEFSLVLSDLTLGNVNYEEQLVLGNLVSGALTANGRVVDRALINPSGFQSLTGLLAEYEGRPFNLRTLNDFNSDCLFTSEIAERAKKVDTLAAFRVLREAASSPRVAQLVESLPLITPLGGTWWYGAPWSEVFPNYFAPLAVDQIYCSPDDGPYSRYVYAFVMSRCPKIPVHKANAPFEAKRAPHFRLRAE